MIGWDKLRVFCCVAQTGSFTRAGEQLNVSQSCVSRHLMDLEHRLGAKLFRRVSKGAVLTYEGEILWKASQKVFTEIETAESLIKQSKSHPEGPLKVVSSTSWIAYLFLEHIEEFIEKYPKINVAISNMDFNPNMNFHHNVDVAVLPHIANQHGLIQNYLMKFHLKLYASPKYLEKYGVPKKPEDLDHHRLLTYGDQELVLPSPMDWHLTLGKKEEEESRQPFMKINSAFNLFHLATKGVGIVTLAKESYLLKTSELVEVLPKIPGPALEAFYIYPKRLEGSMAVKAFESYLREIIQKNGWH